MVVDARHCNPGIVAVQLGKVLGIHRFVEIIHFLEDTLTQLVDQSYKVTADNANILVKPSCDITHNI